MNEWTNEEEENEHEWGKSDLIKRQFFEFIRRVEEEEKKDTDRCKLRQNDEYKTEFPLFAG